MAGKHQFTVRYHVDGEWKSCPWYVVTDPPFYGYGKPNPKNLSDWVSDMAESFEPGRHNHKPGKPRHIDTARIVRTDNGQVVARFVC